MYRQLSAVVDNEVIRSRVWSHIYNWNPFLVSVCFGKIL